MSLLGTCGAAELERDRRTLFAVSHAVLLIGEAASRVSPGTRSEFPDVPWSNVIGDTVHEHIPRLIAALEVAIGNERQ